MSYTGSNYNELPAPPTSVQVHGDDHHHRKPKPLLRCISTLLALTVVGLVIAIFILVLKIRDDQNNTNDSVSQLQTSLAATSSLLHSAILPRAYVTPLVPPRKYQYARGTCWNFATVGAIEHQYRQQAVAAGFLHSDEYVRLSEQAYGNRILYLCDQTRNQTDNPCLLPGDNIAFGSTEGGETSVLWSFQNQLSNAILPDAVCPYNRQVDDSSCPGIDAALSANPIKFTVDSLTTIYDLQSMKEALLTKQYSMMMSTPVWYINYYLPCNDPFAKNDEQCLETNLKPSPCPDDVNANGATRCLKLQMAFNNMDGEFTSHHQMDVEAGHAMLVVGYTDSFVSKDGFKGGLIVRNTWLDGVYNLDEFGSKRNRGSHSLPYFLQYISESDEHLLCPNSDNPRSWATCGAGDTLQDRVQDCMNNPEVVLTATAQQSPLLLQCADPQGSQYAYLCDNSYNTWWAANWTQYFDDMHIGCFIGAQVNNGIVESTTDVCLPPLPIDMYATVFNAQNIPNNYWANDDDFCGFYFYPYAVWDQAKVTFNSGFIQDYKLTFDLQSYLSNAAQYSSLNYTLVKSSTYSQKAAPTAADMPNAYPNSNNAVNLQMNAMRSKYQEIIRQKKSQRKMTARATRFNRDFL